MMKTAVTVLQEMMVKMNEVPEYECISQSGPQHQAMFEYRCTAQGAVVTGQARSKKEAKQEAARRMLLQLHARGAAVPPPFAAPSTARAPSPPEPCGRPALEGGPAAPRALDARSYVAVLRELCEEYRLGEPQYLLVGDTGPPHQRRFTVRAELGLHQRTATSTTKKAARQLAAEHLYTYLRENLARLTKDFVEEEALQRAQEKSMNRARGDSAQARYAERVDAAPAEPAEPGPWRPDLGQRVAHYHHGLRARLGEEVCRRGEEALQAAGPVPEPGAALDSVCDELGLRVECLTLGPAVSVVRLAPCAPPLAFAGADARLAAAAALRYLRRALPARAAPL